VGVAVSAAFFIGSIAATILLFHKQHRTIAGAAIVLGYFLVAVSWSASSEEQRDEFWMSLALSTFMLQAIFAKFPEFKQARGSRRTLLLIAAAVTVLMAVADVLLVRLYIGIVGALLLVTGGLLLIFWFIRLYDQAREDVNGPLFRLLDMIKNAHAMGG
jgi:heme O synthase-like polyprenyltransferase